MDSKTNRTSHSAFAIRASHNALTFALSLWIFLTPFLAQSLENDPCAELDPTELKLAETLAMVEEVLQKLPQDEKNPAVSAYNNQPQYLKSPEYADYVFLFLHGLYGNSSQFSSTSNEVERLGYGYIRSILPGHGYDAPVAISRTFEDWQNIVLRDLKIANGMGKKVVVVGQSTGGMLAIWAASEHPELVDSLILVEPAIYVRPIVTATTCVGKYLYPDARDAKFWTKLIGVDLGSYPLPVATNLGCEVDKLRQAMLQKIKRKNPNTRSESDLNGDTILLAEQIKKPVILIDNANDKILVNEQTLLFVDTLQKNGNKIEHHTINDKQIPHGHHSLSQIVTNQIKTGNILDEIKSDFEEYNFRRYRKQYLEHLEQLIKIAKLIKSPAVATTEQDSWRPIWENLEQLAMLEPLFRNTEKMKEECALKQHPLNYCNIIQNLLQDLSVLKPKLKATQQAYLDIRELYSYSDEAEGYDPEFIEKVAVKIRQNPALGPLVADAIAELAKIHPEMEKKRRLLWNEAKIGKIR